MSSQDNTREKLEKAIIERGNELHWDKNIGCFDEDRVDALIEAWGLLRDYYEGQAWDHRAQEDEDGQPIIAPGLDLSIGVEAVREWLHWTGRFAQDPHEPENDHCGE